MKVCIVAMTGDWGGMEVHTVNLSRELKAKGHDVEIIEIGGGIYDKAVLAAKEGIKVTLVKRKKGYDNLGFFELLRIFLPLKGEVFLLPKGTIDKGNWLLDALARVLFRHYISIEHLECEPMPKKEISRHFKGLLPGLGLWWYRLYLERRARAFGPHRIICVSDAVRTRLTELYHFPPRKLTAIRNGIDIEMFKPSLEMRSVIRTEWGIPEDALLFGSMGRLSPQKGFDDSIRLFKDLAESTSAPAMRYVIMGEGPSRGVLEALIDERCLGDKVFLRGFSDRPWEIYPAFDVFLMPSRNEGLPLTLLEAMASGCCPIAMGVGGIPEVITNQGLGWLVPPGDNPGFLAAMRDAANSGPGRLAEVGRNARDHVVSHFEAKKQYSRIVDLIEKEYLSSNH